MSKNVQNHKYFAGIIGESPSKYSKSPAIWNAAFKALKINAVYKSFDVSRHRLKAHLSGLRRQANLLGLNVTIPHKIEAAKLLDTLDAEARRVGAVNTIIRGRDGCLAGGNTDGLGTVQSLTRTLPGEKRRFMNSLSGKRVILLGAGGSARAAAFALARAVGRRGRLLVYNRTRAKAADLARRVFRLYKNCQPLITSLSMRKHFEEADLLVSAMGPVPLQPLTLPLDSLKPSARFFDLTYSPAETPFLQEGRRRGHSTRNGEAMLVWQAVESFIRMTKTASRGKITAVMTRAARKAGFHLH